MADPRAELHPPLAVSGRLDVEVDGGSATLTAEGGTIRLEVADEAALRATLRGLPDRLMRRGGVARGASRLRAAGLTLEVRVGGSRLLSAGRGVRPSPTARIAGLGPLDARLVTLIKLARMR